MRWIYKLFNATTPEERKGISLKIPKWEIFAYRDFPSFLKALPLIIPENSVLYLEGGTPTKEIKSFLETHKEPKPSKVALGTIWPRPICYHLPFTTENIIELANIMERHATPEAAIHFHVYKDDEILLEWYDAFFDDPMYLSEEISEEKIKQFCEKLSLKYKPLTQ